MEGLLDVDCAEDGAAGAGERDHLAVAGALDLDAAVAGDLLADSLLDRPEELARRFITDAVGQLGRADDIGEDDGDGAVGELADHGPYSATGPDATAGD